MATRKRAATKSPEPLKAFGPDQQPVAYSYDGGENWSQVPQRKMEQPSFSYTRRLVALYPDQITPCFQRRVIASFAPLSELKMLTGWGTLADLEQAAPKDVDAIVLPVGPGMVAADYPELISSCRKLAPLVVIDIDPFLSLDREQAALVAEAVRLADAVTTPSELLTMQLRGHNPQAFTVPPVVNQAFWRAGNRENSETVRFAVQPTTTRVVNESIDFLREKWGDRVSVVVDDPAGRHATQDPDFYEQVDVLVVGPPENRTRMTSAGLLPGMYAGCAVVADVNYHRTVLHNHSGVLVAKPGPQMWRQELSRMVSDSNHRLKMGKGARLRAHQQTARAKLGPLSTPYRILIPGRE